MAYTKYVRNVLQDLSEEFACKNMTVKFEGIHEGNLLFSTDHVPVDGQIGCYGYPLYVLVDTKDPDMRAYVPDYDFKLTNAVKEIKQQRKLERAQKQYVANVLRTLKEELACQGMSVTYEGVYEGNLLFFTYFLPVDGQRGVFGYPQYVLVDPKDPYIRAYVSDQDLKLTNFVMDIRQQRKLERAKKKAEKKAQAGVQQSLQ